MRQFLGAAIAIRYADCPATIAPGSIDIVVAVAYHDRTGWIDILTLQQICKQVAFVLASAVEFTTVDAIERCRNIEMPEDASRVNMRLGSGKQQSIISRFQIGKHFRHARIHDVFEQAGFGESFAVQLHRLFDNDRVVGFQQRCK